MFYSYLFSFQNSESNVPVIIVTGVHNRPFSLTEVNRKRIQRVSEFLLKIIILP